MPGSRYLADTSVFASLTRPAVSAAFAPLVAGGRVVLCAPVAFEIGYAARSPADYRELEQRLLTFPSVPVTESDHRRALRRSQRSLLAASTEACHWWTRW